MVAAEVFHWLRLCPWDGVTQFLDTPREVWGDIFHP